MAIEFGDVRLDVQQGRAADHIDIGNVQEVAFDVEQPDGRDPKRRGSGRRAGSEKTAFLTVEKWSDPQARRRRPMQPVDQPYTFKPFEILQGSLKSGFDG